MSIKKIILTGIIGLIFIIQGCSVLERSTRAIARPGQKMDIHNAAAVCKVNNISGKDLTISRLKIHYRSADIDKSVSGFMKRDAKGNVLFSIRSLAGIEVARALITSDSLKVLDKLNSILYVQSVEYLETKFGLSKDHLSILWGDYPYTKAVEFDFKQKEGDIWGKYSDGNLNHGVIFDTTYNKLKLITVERENGKSLSAKYEDFIEDGALVYPRRGIFNIDDGDIVLDITYGGVKNEDINSMKFNKGRNYTTVILK